MDSIHSLTLQYLTPQSLIFGQSSQREGPKVVCKRVPCTGLTRMVNSPHCSLSSLSALYSLQRKVCWAQLSLFLVLTATLPPPSREDPILFHSWAKLSLMSGSLAVWKGDEWNFSKGVVRVGEKKVGQPAVPGRDCWQHSSPQTPYRPHPHAWNRQGVSVFPKPNWCSEACLWNST